MHGILEVSIHIIHIVLQLVNSAQIAFPVRRKIEVHISTKQDYTSLYMLYVS